MENNFLKNKINEYDRYIVKIQPRRDFYLNSRKNLIKNYVLDPDVKIVK